MDLYVANAGLIKELISFIEYEIQVGFQGIETGPMIEGWERDARGAAWSDYNNDGAPDLFVATDDGLNGLIPE